jgi:hypothetical protein
MSELFEAYARAVGVRVSGLRFFLNGDRIKPDQTAAMLELGDQDCIECTPEQPWPVKVREAFEQVRQSKISLFVRNPVRRVACASASSPVDLSDFCRLLPSVAMPF